MKLSISETLSLLPAQSGIYIMRNRDDVIIYIGKAKILRNRVRSYFSGEKDPKTRILVNHVERIDFIVTNNEYEALILENNLIKQHNPRYNISLKDGKTYPVIRFTNEEFPRVFRTRNIVQDGSTYFGPYTDLDAIDRYLELIEEFFPLRKCKGPLKKRESPCLYYHIKRCGGPCAGLMEKKDYMKQVKAIMRMLEGDIEGLQTSLQKRMAASSRQLRFEEAAKLRDAIKALSGVVQDQKVQDFDPESRDYLSWFQEENLLCVGLFQMRNGKLLGNRSFRLKTYHDAREELSQFILQFYSAEEPPPSRLILEGIEDAADIERFFVENFAIKTVLQAPNGSRDLAVLGMVRENARQDLSRWKTETGDTSALKDLQAVLGLEKLPMRIEGFDIAHLHGKHTVAAMVSFYKGIPDKKSYRIYHIKSLHGAIDDYESLREALARRYSRLINEKLTLPDLILIDGGKGQLNACQEILQALGLAELNICSLAKENEEIFVPGRSEAFRLPDGSPSLRILQAVRDESHRFGTNHNQRLRSSDVKLDALESITGIGPSRAKTLMAAFGNLEAVKQAGVNDLIKIGGLPANLAAEVQRHFALEALQVSTYDPQENQELLAAETATDYQIES